ncbi:MAG: hypothetical protein ACLFRD_06465 [Nitriliruptoraceae bacterium]
MPDEPLVQRIREHLPQHRGKVIRISTSRGGFDLLELRHDRGG